LRGWGSKDKSLDNLSDRLDRLEEEIEVKPVDDNEAATTVGVMKIQTLCFRTISKNRTSIQSVRGKMFVIPVPLSKYHKEMLVHCRTARVSQWVHVHQPKIQQTHYIVTWFW
jgi:hypothetical protein